MSDGEIPALGWRSRTATLLGAACLLLACPSETDGPGTGGSPGAGGQGGSSCAEEICDGLDNDCDGDVDEDCPCTPEDVQRCYGGDPLTLGVGSCGRGSQECDATGFWGSCSGWVGPSAEECNASDDDCDGLVDEDCPCEDEAVQDCYGAPPITINIGHCRAGSQLCAGGAWGPCEGWVGPGTEVCNGVDDDCDGLTDGEEIQCGCNRGTGGPDSLVVPTPTGYMCIDSTEVTRGQYQAWLDTSPDTSDQPSYCSWNTDLTPQDTAWPPTTDTADLPVFGVDWCDARAFCEAHDKRLCGRIGSGDAVPTGGYADYYESEWYNACTDRGLHVFPYGTTYDPNACNGNDAGLGAAASVGAMADCRGAFPVFDLSGNLWEWENSCAGEAGASDSCRIRGGAWNAASALMVCSADLMQTRDTKSPTLGFRCCLDPED